MPEAVPAASSVEWAYDPWRENARGAWLATASALLLSVLVVLLRESVVVTGALVVFCLAAFAPAMTAVECRMDEAGAAKRGWFGWERRAWASIRRVDVVPAGVLLSPYADRHWLDAQRALALPMPAMRRAELMAELDRFRETHER